jgi:hypothetical protein
MAQHDYNLANQSGADFRADLNNALEAIATVNSGATEPSTTFAHQLWVDTANSVLKIRNAADSDWITFGVSISSSNVFTGNLTGDVVGDVTGNVTGNVTGDLTGNADTATTLETARTISLSGDVVGSVSFDGSADVDISTVVQINSITLGTDTTGDYVESISGGTGVTITGGTGESSTPVVAIGQAVAVTSDVTFNTITATDEFIGDLEGGVRFSAKADGALSKGDVVYISGVSGDVPTVAKAKADDASKMPAFGLAFADANDNAELQVVTFGTIESLDTSNVSVGEILYVSTTAGEYTATAPTGESSQIQNIGKVQRSHAAAGSIKVGGAGRSNATPNLDNGKIFIGNGSNQSATSTLDTSIVPENTNLYWTTARGESMFDTRLATKSTSDVQEGSNLYYTTARVNSDFDTRLATKDTDSLSEGVSNLYYTTARVNSDFDTRLATKDTSDLVEGSNLYYTTARVNSDFDTRLATKSTSDVQEGVNLYYTDARFDSRLATKDTDDVQEGSTNLYYTTARFDSAFGNKTTNDLTENTNLYYTDARANSAIDSRVTKTFVDALNIQAASVDANSVTLGTDTTGNYIQTITGTANKITVTGSGSESADVTLTLPDDVQIADSLTVAGNLTVNGTLTSLDTTNLDIEDNLFQLNAGLTGSPVNDSGMLINRGDQDNGIFMWDESADKFTLGLTTADGSATGNITLNSLGTLVANIEGNITGNVTGTVSDVSNHDTDDISEGSSNLYYTDARADARVNLQTGANLDLSSKSTSDLSEGTNEYFTTARARSSISASGDIAYNSSTGVISFTASAAPVTSVNTLTGAVVLDSDDIAEGSTNLYYTDARARAAISENSTQLSYNSTTGVLTYTQGDTDTVSEGTTNLYYTSARFDSAFSGKSTSDLSEGTNLYYTDARFDTRLATKDTDDVSEGASNLYYTSARFDSAFTAKSTSDLSEGTNLYYTDTRARAAVNASGDLSYNSGTGVFSFTERTDAEVQGLITAGTGVTVSSGQVSIGQAVATSDSPTFANMTLNGTDSIKISSGTTAQRNATPVAGMFRYNTTTGEFEGYTDEWGAIGGGGGSFTTDIFAGDGSTVNFTVTSSVGNENDLMVFIDGVFQAQDSYSVSGTTLTFSTAPANGRVITVYHAKAVSIGTPSDNSVGVTQLDLSDGTNGQVLTTDGAGTLSFSTVSGYTDSDVETYLDGGTSTPTFSTATVTGDLLAGTSSSNYSAVGSQLGTGGNNYMTRSNAQPLLLNRLSSDGDVLLLMKDSTTVGSISSISGTSASYNSASGLVNLGANQSNYVRVVTSTASGQPRFEPSADGTVDLAQSGLRFKNLYLSGGAYLGGTGSANHLDDYEEGTFTVTATPSVSGTVTLTSLNVGHYTKIGNRVFFSYRVDVASVSSPSGRLNMNLPFTVANISPTASSRSTATTFVYNSVSTNIGDFVSFIPTGTSFVSIYVGSSATGSNTSANQMQTGTEIHLAGHYITN